MKTILELFESVVSKYPEKIAFTDSKREITYIDLFKESRKIGTNIINKKFNNKPIGILLDKSINCLSSMLGVLYSGNFYTVIDVDMPVDRINSIISTLDLEMIITSNTNKKINDLEYKNDIIYFEELKDEISEDKLNIVRSNMIDTDTAYVLFTSGSTGIPKGTVISHKALLSYVNWVVKEFNFNKNTVFGSQTPFYFSMSITDLYSTLVTGATFHIIPKMYFSFPIKLIAFLNEKKVNTIYWVPSALCIVANLKTFDTIKPKYLRKVLFAGEVMPTKQLNIWINNLPKVEFANLFGPTESTDICTFYRVNRKFKDSESIPIGKSCDNCGVLIINDEGKLCDVDEQGELYIKGSFLSNGYYNNKEKTDEAFIQNPLNDKFPEIVYKTGDIVKLNNKNEIIYLSRKDFQIKRKGYRIELGEIENAVNSLDGITSCASIYDNQNEKIVLFYQSNTLSDSDIKNQVNSKVPRYMYPDKIIKLKRMYYNANGKIDKIKLKEIYEGEIK